MFRKLMIATALALTTAAATVTPAPAIDFFCSCSVCKDHLGLKCWDVNGNPVSTYCGAYYPTHCG